MIYHIGTFQLADRSRAQEAVDAIWRLKDVAPGTIDYKVGVCPAPTPTTADVCLMGVFDTMENYQIYMNHPVHTEEVAPLLAELCDYEVLERMRGCWFEV